MPYIFVFLFIYFLSQKAILKLSSIVLFTSSAAAQCWLLGNRPESGLSNLMLQFEIS